jgi:hypothetical protein
MRIAHGYRLGSTPAQAQDIEISDEERSRGLYAIGLPGSGKTSGVFKVQTIQDTAAGQPFGLFDIEGNLATGCLRAFAAHGTPPERVIYIDPTRTDATVPLNFLAVPPGQHPQNVLEGIVSSMRRIWWDSWGPRSDDVVRNALTALMETRMSLCELPRFLSDADFRKAVVDQCADERVQLYFGSHLKGIRDSERRTWFEPIRNKADMFLNPFVRPFLAADTCLDFRRIMNDSYLLVRVEEAQLKDVGRLFSLLLLNALYQAALSRPEDSRLWLIYADEYQNLASQVFEHIGTRLRKRSVGLGAVAHQSLAQSPFDKDPSIVATLLNSSAVTMFFQLGRRDAEELAPEVFPLTGTVPKRVKKKHPLWGGEDVQSFYSIQEERAAYASQLEHQEQRQCFVKIRRRTGIEVYVAEAYEVPELPATEDDAERLAKASLAIHGLSPDALLKAQNDRLRRLAPQEGKRAQPRPQRDSEADPWGEAIS